MHRPLSSLVVAGILASVGCGGVTSVILGEVEADVAGHHVLVTDCYRTSPPAPKRLPDENGLPVYEYAPCRDAVLRLRGAELTVNGTAYGALGAGDEVLVDHGRVSIKRTR